MINLTKHNVVFFDVDDTLIFYKPKENLPSIEIIDPLTSHKIKLWIHTEHVERIKILSTKGEAVIVWSQAGSEWCKTICDRLELTPFVYMCMTKPQRYYDDLEITTFMERRYIKL